MSAPLRETAIPILRIFSVEEAREFYVDLMLRLAIEQRLGRPGDRAQPRAYGLSPLRSLRRIGTPGRSKVSRRLFVR